jgi:hypothetical protein
MVQASLLAVAARVSILVLSGDRPEADGPGKRDYQHGLYPAPGGYRCDDGPTSKVTGARNLGQTSTRGKRSLDLPGSCRLHPTLQLPGRYVPSAKAKGHDARDLARWNKIVCGAAINRRAAGRCCFHSDRPQPPDWLSSSRTSTRPLRLLSRPPRLWPVLCRTVLFHEAQPPG